MTVGSAETLVRKLHEATRTGDMPLGRSFDCLYVAQQIEALLAAGDALAAVLRSGSDCGWDAAIDGWEKVRNG